MKKNNVKKQKIDYTWDQFHNDITQLAFKISLSQWVPDYIYGVTRGGLIPAVRLSHLFKMPMLALHVGTADFDYEGQESNCAAAEDAFNGKNILIVDDVTATGKTFEWIMDDWRRSCLPSDPKWDKVWHQNVRFATLFEVETFEHNPVGTDYTVHTVGDSWVVMPWEPATCNYCS